MEPEYLHKYRSLDGDNMKFVRQSLITKTLWLSNPAAFNDPFDCAPYLDVTWNHQARVETAVRIANGRSQGLPRWQRRKELRTVTTNVSRLGVLDREDVQRVASDVLSDIRNNMGVLSLSGDPVNVLMWSHYARSHTGVLLTFRTDQGDLISEAQRVLYAMERPVVDVVGERASAMQKTLLHKADYWEYELEWRVIRPGRPRAHAFNPASLEAIIFGARTTDEDKQAVKQAAEIGGLKPRYAQALFDDRIFELHLIPE